MTIWARRKKYAFSNYAARTHASTLLASASRNMNRFGCGVLDERKVERLDEFLFVIRYIVGKSKIT